MKYGILLVVLLLPSVLFGATVYVDPALTSDCDGSSYYYNPLLGTGDTCRVSGAGAKAWNTLQDAIYGAAGTPGAAAGDTIYLRAGTYSEGYGPITPGHGTAMQVSTQLNGTSGNYTTIASYPGEWAIIDASTQTSYLFAIGYGGLSWNSGAGALAYIKFERLGITGGSSGGIGVKGGPIWVRYCYIYENGKGELGDGNRGGIHGQRMKESLIEYNYFYNNAGTEDHNKAHIVVYADYLYTSNTFDIDNCDKENEIRYNYFGSGSYTGYKDKAAQYFDDRESSPTGIQTDMTYQDSGNRIHHNIFIGTTYAIDSHQDFAQLYNNIADSALLGSPDYSTSHPTYHGCFYNNTVINSYITKMIGDERTEPNLDLAFFCANNIVSEYGASYDSPSISVATFWHFEAPCTYDYTWTNTLIDRNLIYQPESARHFGLPNSQSTACKATRWIGTTAFNAQHASDKGITIANYTTATNGLFLGTSGANKYITSGSFVVGSSTIANGGEGVTSGNAHPYLSGVTIPSYIGAVNPSDSDWVAGVLGLATDSNEDGIPDNLLSATAGSDPTWIEGSESTFTGVMTGIIR